MKYYEWRAAEIFSVLPKVIRNMSEEDRAEFSTYAMIRHSEEAEMVAQIIQAATAGVIKNG